MSPHRRALIFLAVLTACERPSPAGPGSGGDQTAAETNPATFDVATSEPGSSLPFLTLNQRALFERGRGVFQTEFTPATGLGPLGFGLLEAGPDAEILALADPSDRNGDGISGRPNRTADGRLGRFGRKAQFATLSEFNAGAFVNEMGITSPAEPNEQLVRGQAFPPGVDPTPDPELTQEALDATNAFVRLLAPPRPLPRGVVEQRGALAFLRIGCASCHFPALVTGPNRVAALSLKIVQAYTDLLLHDMGPDLADICLRRAEP